MPSIRKLAAMAGAVLAVGAAAVPAASAQTTIQDSSTHTALASGATFNGHSTNFKIVGSFFGVTTTITCATTAFVATVTTNPTATLNSFICTGVKNQSGTACTFTTLNLPWVNALTFTSTTNMQLAIPANGGFQFSGAGCLPLSSTCTFGAGQTFNFAWSNANGTATLNQSISSPTCGTGTASGTFTLRTGSTVLSGNLLEVA